MATLTFNGNTYTVDHAVKGTNYVHGYDASGTCIVSIDGVTDFSGIKYSGVYMSPEECITEKCNDLKYCGGAIKTADNKDVTVPIANGGTGATTGAEALKNLLASGPMVLSPHQYGDTLPEPGIPGRIFFLKV